MRVIESLDDISLDVIEDDAIVIAGSHDRFSPGENVWNGRVCGDAVLNDGRR